MIIQKNCSFFKNYSNGTPIVSKIFPNSTGDVLSLQITGANGIYYLEGRNNDAHDWVSLAGINLSDLSAVKGSFTKAGLYEVGIAGVRELRIRLESAEGVVTIFGQIISMEET